MTQSFEEGQWYPIDFGPARCKMQDAEHNWATYDQELGATALKTPCSGRCSLITSSQQFERDSRTSAN